MWHLMPTMFLGLFPLAIAHEGLSFLTTDQLFAAGSFTKQLPVIMKMLVGGIVAFFLGFSEYLLLSNTSSLTLSICGIFKEICTLLLASHYNNDNISTMNWIGFSVCVSGIILHVYLKNRYSAEQGSSQSEEIRMELLGHNDLTTSNFDSSSEDELFSRI